MSEGVMHYGEYGVPVVGDASVDKLNIVSVEVHIPYADPVDFSFLDIRRAPTGLVGLPCVTAKLAVNKGFHVIVYSFDGKTDTVTTTPSERLYDLEGTDEDVAIETHPQFLALVAKYGGAYNADGSFAGFPKVAPGALAGAKSRMYGEDQYVSIGWVWTMSYTSASIPYTAYVNAGCIEDPAGYGSEQPPDLDGVRNWLKLAPRCSWRGNVWSITERWRASGRAGWNPDVYRTTA